jgi:NADH-quinone oxidoreductase subunit J
MNWVEFAVFVVFALAAVAGGMVMVGARNPVHSAMGLLTAMFSVAVFYVLNLAHFVAAVQVIIYAGAVMTLFLFVIMLIGVDRSEDANEQIPFQRPIAAVLGLGVLVLVFVAAGFTDWIPNSTGADTLVAAPAPDGTIEAVSDELFGTWLLPFEATILLLTIAAVGTIALAQFREGRGRPIPDNSPSAQSPQLTAQGSSSSQSEEPE